MQTEERFYAVRRGYKPGIYKTWAECQQQTAGFKGAVFKCFLSRNEAVAFMNYDGSQEKPLTAEDAVGSGRREFYAVRRGRVPGVYATWDGCKAQIDNFAYASYRKFRSFEEADNFVKGIETPESERTQPKPPPSVELPDGPYAFVDGSYNSKTKVYGYGGFLVADGKRYPLTGSGVDPEMASMRNVAGEIMGSMAAVLKAEELGLSKLTILYDYYGIERWATNRWNTYKRGTMEYQDFMNCPDRIELHFKKVTAHSGIEGNEMADVMAKDAVGIKLTSKQERVLAQALGKN